MIQAQNTAFPWLTLFLKQQIYGFVLQHAFLVSIILPQLLSGLSGYLSDAQSVHGAASSISWQWKEREKKKKREIVYINSIWKGVS